MMDNNEFPKVKLEYDQYSELLAIYTSIGNKQMLKNRFD